MKARSTHLPGVVVLEPRIFHDDRGFFFESYSQRNFAELGISTKFVQDNHSRSVAGVLRGLHYQLGTDGAPGQAKLVRVTRGCVLDVAVDVRRGSPTFLQWTAVELSESTNTMLHIPAGYAHGFWSIEPSDVLYKCSVAYAPTLERGVRWDDVEIGIDWPGKRPHLSPRDAALPSVAEMQDHDFPEYLG